MPVNGPRRSPSFRSCSSLSQVRFQVAVFASVKVALPCCSTGLIGSVCLLWPALNDFPIVSRTSDAADGQFPALGWQTFVANRTVARYLLSHRWWDERVEASRYCQLPVANLSQDLEVCIADIQFSRILEVNLLRCCVRKCLLTLSRLGGCLRR